MIRKIAVTTALIALPFAAAQADGSAGCGLGKMVLEGKSGTGTNIGAAILNNLIIPQTSAMTTGTMGCDTSTQVNNDQQREVFVASNRDSLSSDMAKGNGDYLASLADMMQVSEKDKPSFFRVTQDNYDAIALDSGAEPAAMLAALDNVLSQDNELARYVR